MHHTARPFRTTFPQRVPSDGTFLLRQSDNVMDWEDHPVIQLTMSMGVCVGAEVIRDGIYSTEGYIGQLQGEIQEAVDYDPTGSHPEQYTEIVEHNPLK